jgi:hypothetical protein
VARDKPVFDTLLSKSVNKCFRITVIIIMLQNVQSTYFASAMTGLTPIITCLFQNRAEDPNDDLVDNRDKNTVEGDAREEATNKTLIDEPPLCKSEVAKSISPRGK